MVEDRRVVVLARDDHALVPGAGIGDPLVVDLGSEFGVARGKRIAGVVHAAAAVAAADDGDELARLLVVVGGDELDEWLLGGPAAPEGDDVLPGASPSVLANRLAEPDPQRAFGARGSHEHAVRRVAIAALRPPIGLALAVTDNEPFRGEVRRSVHGGSARGDEAGAGGPDDRILEAGLRQACQEGPEL